MMITGGRGKKKGIPMICACVIFFYLIQRKAAWSIFHYSLPVLCDLFVMLSCKAILLAFSLFLSTIPCIDRSIAGWKEVRILRSRERRRFKPRNKKSINFNFGGVTLRNVK